MNYQQHFPHQHNSSGKKQLKQLIVLYFWLILFEGALRKWVLPQLATPLLIIRDPIVALIYFKAFSTRSFNRNVWIDAIFLMAIISFFFTFLVGHRNLVVSIYGLRTNFLHVPLIFVMAQNMNIEDVKKYIKWMVYLTPPVTILLILQFYSPETAWVNRGVGGVGTAGFAGALGRMRPPTLFSFITGTAQFYTLATASCVATFFHFKKFPKAVLNLSIICIIISIPLSISRLQLFSVLLVVVFFLLSIFTKDKYRKHLPKIIIGSVLLIYGASSIPFMADGMSAFLHRWETASSQSGSAVDGTLGRFLHDLARPLIRFPDTPLMGYGIGMGTNAGMSMMGHSNFILGESELERCVGEMGVIGLFFIAFRLSLTYTLLMRGFKSNLSGNNLPWLLVSTCFLLLFWGQWGQPTTLGFACFTAGLCLASLNHDSEMR
jgi:hypothetical protein